MTAASNMTCANMTSSAKNMTIVPIVRSKENGLTRTFFCPNALSLTIS